MVIANVYRGRTGSLEVTVPWMGSSNEGLIRSMLPEGAQVRRGSPKGVWLVGRAHLTALVTGLVQHSAISDVELKLYQHGTGGCVYACYSGSDSDEAILMCECSCVGLNHGSGHPPDGARLVGASLAVGDVYRFPGGVRTVMYSELREEFDSA
jgi:hypothetical protein